MLCFIGETRDLVHAVMRGGKDCHIGKSESVSFVREALGGLPIKSCLVRVRADSGFYNHEFLEYLGSKGHQYAVVAHAQEGMQHKIGGVEFKEVSEGVEVGEFLYKGTSWKRERRVVVIRVRVRGDGANSGKQLRLLKEWGYTYQIIVTNLECAPEDVWRFYNKRCNAENFIKEGIYDFNLDKLVSHSYSGNACWRYLCLLAYNLTNWLKDIGFDGMKHKRMTRWFRDRFLCIAAKMVISGRRIGFKLSRTYPYQDEYWEAVRRIEAFKPVS